jgi:hypothetical protein
MNESSNPVAGSSGTPGEPGVIGPPEAPIEAAQAGPAELTPGGVGASTTAAVPSATSPVAPPAYPGPAFQLGPTYQSPTSYWTPPAPVPSRSRNLALPVVSIGLSLLLVAVAAFSYVMVSNTNADLSDTQGALATEQAARQAARDHAAALEECVAALLADETAQDGLKTLAATAQARELAAQDADEAYSAALNEALQHYEKSVLDLLNSDTKAEFEAALREWDAAYQEWQATATLKGKVEAARIVSDDATSRVETAQTSLDTQMSQTQSVCGAARVSPAPSASPISQ